MTTTVQQHLMAFSSHPFYQHLQYKKDKTNSHRTTKILNITIKNIVVSSVFESIKGIQRNNLLFKKKKKRTTNRKIVGNDKNSKSETVKLVRS